ncbi:MAG TPA: hypothetical protein VFX92_01530 [Candidatus Krumholzibacteria bacterium]|nr:hypothetical protein [Candidatus Krumholzibacteria bacterium]
MRKRHFAFAAFAVLVLGLVACDDAPESGRLTASVVSFNNGSPVESDVSDGGVVYEDLIPVSFTARPYSEFVTVVDGGPHSEMIVESYRIVWTRVDGGSGVLATRTENTHVYMQVGDITGSAVRLVTWDDKTGSVLAPLVGTTNQIMMRADITFTGREVGTEEEIEFMASINVHFADTL